jgi:TolB-like protein
MAVGYFALDKFLLSKRSVASLSGESAPSAIPEKSIAVLPFVNMSPDKEQDYFSEGLSEELIDLLAPVPDLRVRRPRRSECR